MLYISHGVESSSVVFPFLLSLCTKGLQEERGRGGMAEREKMGVQLKGLNEAPFHLESSRVGIQTLYLRKVLCQRIHLLFLSYLFALHPPPS